MIEPQRTTLHHFPKWLLQERFELTHSPKLDQPFTVVLFDRVSGRHYGAGQSIAEAAKAALKKREATAAKVPFPLPSVSSATSAVQS